MATDPQFPPRTPPRPYKRRAHRSYLPRTSGYTAPKPRVAPPPPAAAPTRPEETPASGLRDLVAADLYRKTSRKGVQALLGALVTDAGFKHTFWFRVASACRGHKTLRRTLYPFVRAVYNHYQYKHGVFIPPTTRVGPGLYLEHLGDIFVNGRAVIGKNCNLGNGVTIGQTNRGTRQGVPTVGDNVFIGPGAKVVGNVTVGNNVAVGVNCVVTEDVPEGAVVAATPGKVVSYRGSSGYVNRTDY